jgi:hypothetical protein
MEIAMIAARFLRTVIAAAVFGTLGTLTLAAQPAPRPERAISLPTFLSQFAPSLLNQVQPTPAPAQPTLAQPTPAQATPMQPGQQAVIDEGVDAPGSTPAPSSLPAPASAEVRRPPHIVYDTDGDARRMYRSGSVEMIMVTQNPADHCVYEIPLCIPACVTGTPAVSSYCGLFGRGVVRYCWPCGFEAIVKFRNIGDVRVDYEGD